MEEKYIITFSEEDKENGAFTGEYGPCVFVSGKTETTNPWFAAWFEGNGFKVEKVGEKVDYSTYTVEQLKELATSKGITFDSKAKKDDLIKLIEGAE